MQAKAPGMQAKARESHRAGRKQARRTPQLVQIPQKPPLLICANQIFTKSTTGGNSIIIIAE